MSVAERLDRFRDSLTGCDLVVLADLSTEMVLSSSADMVPSQERLDAMTAEATAAIEGPVGEGAALLLRGEPRRPGLAVVADATRLCVFVGSGTERSEALLISLAPGAPLDGVFDCARKVIADILAHD